MLSPVSLDKDKLSNENLLEVIMKKELQNNPPQPKIIQHEKFTVLSNLADNHKNVNN